MGKLIDTSACLMLVVYPSHPFAKRDSIRLKEAAQESFIAISRECCFRRFMDKVFEMAGFSPNIILECDFALRKPCWMKNPEMYSKGSMKPWPLLLLIVNEYINNQQQKKWF